jgi:hypothetical protein
MLNPIHLEIILDPDTEITLKKKMHPIFIYPRGAEFIVLIIHHFKSLSSIAFWRILENTSDTNRKRYGESGSPCLMPLVGLKLYVSVPFIFTLYSTEVMQLMIQSTNLMWNPIFFRIIH